MEELNRNNNDDFVLKRVARRSAFGALIGVVIGLMWNPPFKGITTTSNDVQGLTYFSWLMAAGVGMIFGAFAGLLGMQQHQEQNRTERTTTTSFKEQSRGQGGSNQAL